MSVLELIKRADEVESRRSYAKQEVTRILRQFEALRQDDREKSQYLRVKARQVKWTHPTLTFQETNVLSLIECSFPVPRVQAPILHKSDINVERS